MLAIINCDALFWGTAIVVSVYYGFRAKVFCELYRPEMVSEQWKSWQKYVVWYVQDGIFNFVCGIVGFVSVRLLAHILLSLQGNYSNITPGMAAFLIFLSLVAVLGVSGSLPRILSRANIDLLKLKGK